MFRSYLTVALRNLRKHKTYSAINIAGLAIGMACCAVILFYVQYELSYDHFHSKVNRIYRVLRETQDEGGRATFRPGISGPFAPALIKDFPEVESAVRVTGNSEVWTRYEGERQLHARRRWFFVEPDFFKIFDFPFVIGDPEKALQDPRTMLISETMAKHYFGSQDPIGKVITIEGAPLYMNFDLVVAGVVKVPKNTIFQFDMVASATILNQDKWHKERWQTWDTNYHVRPFETYVLLREGTSPETFKAKLPEFIERYMGKEARANNAYHFQPLERIYLYSYADYEDDLTGGVTTSYGDIQNVYLFSGIAFLILLIACANFMNLATARSVNRAKEVGLRKVSGAYRLQLIWQFLGEAILLSFIASILALGLVELTLPNFSAFMGRDIAPQRHISYLILIPGFVIFVGLLAGYYPAFFLSAFEPVSVLKGQSKIGLKGSLLRAPNKMRL